MTYAATDSRKEEFRKYLEKNGVVSQLTRVMVGLYDEPDRPANAVEYIKKFPGAPHDVDVDALKKESKELDEEKIVLEKRVKELEARLTELTEEDKPATEEGAGE